MRIPTYSTENLSQSLNGVDRYRLIEELGEGGMGVVWRALDSKTGGEVAIKIMKDMSDAECLQLFTREWRTLSHLCHPNIVDVRDADVFREDGEQKPFFVMPLLPGVTLAELILTASQRLTCARVVEIFSQVCRGLQAAHQQGVIHRDLKPSNIFVMDDDTAKIIDFGIVHLAGAHSVPGQKGTFQYMAPEQILMKEISPAADLFALGVSLYEALTGRKPFARPTVEETVHAVLNETPPPVSELNPVIPYAISQVVHKCIAKQSVNRFSSARELAEMLGKAFRNEAIFDLSRMRDRLERIRATVKTGDLAFASELLVELESEGHLNPELALLHTQVDLATKMRRIDHLLSAAKARIDQGEIPLGLEKLRELLELDPDNVDALALKARGENQRSEALALKWIELAHTHLNNCDFVAARHAATEALKSREGEPRALELLRRIDSVEIEAKRVRDQKEQLYLSALRDYQNGEIDSALSRLGRLFSVLRSRPEGAVPERDAVYESLYKEVCSEHDLVRARIEEAQRLLADEDFARALSICTEQLGKYPNNGSFQALKIQVEDAERQKVSADLATTSRNADAEPDLDRRANIWREAAERYPNDAQFAQQLRVACERRELVNAIVAKAHQFSEKGLFAEELAQWDMLSNIHPRYPGIAIELDQCRKRRDQQVRQEEKAHVVEEIVSLMETRQFKRAVERARTALSEYPNDPELSGLEKLSEEGLDRTSECNRLFIEAQREAAANNRSRATVLLKEALRLDSRNAAVQDVLINLLVEQGRDLLETDLAGAEALHKEAGALNAVHRSVRSFGVEVAHTGRQRFVGQCVTRARGLVAMGEAARAWECVQLGIESYPGEMRLRQFRDQLLKENPELQRTATPAATPEQEQAAGAPAPENDLPDGPPIGRDSLAGQVMPADEIDESTRAAGCGTEGTVPGEIAATRVVQALHSDGPGLLSAENANVQCAAGERVVENGDVRGPNLSDDVESPRPRVWGRGVSKRMQWVLGIAGGLALLAAAVTWMHAFPSRAKVENVPRASFVTLRVAAIPVDSTIRVGGASQAGGEIRIPANGRVTLEVAHPGYRSRTVQIAAGQQPSTVVLEPLPVQISVRTAQKKGRVEVDGKNAGELAEGSLASIDVAADAGEHEIAVVANGQRVASLRFLANPGQPPLLRGTHPEADLRNMIVVSSMGSKAVVYASSDVKNLSLDARPLMLGASGGEVSLTGSGGSELTYLFQGEGGALSLERAETPSLSLWSAGAPAELLITANLDGATLTANGNAVRRSQHGWRITDPGTYNFVLTADKYQPQSWTTVLKARQTIHLERGLVAQASEPEALSAFSVSGGTPGALVSVDGTVLGELDGKGTAQFGASLNAGRHVVHFRKDGSCSERDEEANVMPPAEIHLEGVALETCAQITLHTSSPPATVKAIRKGDAGAKWVSLVADKTIALPAGVYQLAVESEGNRSYSAEVRLEAGKNVDFSPQFAPLHQCKVQNAPEVLIEGDWIKPKNGNGTVDLSAGCVQVNLVFRKPKATFIGKRRVEWSLQSGGGRIEWTLEGQRLSRKSTLQRSFDQHEVDIRSLLNTNAEQYSIQIRVNGSQVVITNDEGSVLDSYQPQDPALRNLAEATLSIRNSAGFKFSSRGM